MEKTVWVNKRREEVRIGERSELTSVGDEYKQSVNTWIINKKKEFLLQKRSANKKHNPNKWACTGGGTKAGESSIDAAIRECKEELNIDINRNNLEYKMTLQREYDYVDVFVLYEDIDIKSITFDEKEVSEVGYFSVEEIDKMIDNDELAPSSRAYFGMLLVTLDKDFDNSYVKRLIKK